MSFAVLWVADFCLHALRRSEPGLLDRPVALIAGEGRKAVLTEVSPEAKEVEPGCVVTLAMARCPGIVLRTRDAGAEVEAHRILLAAAFALSPRVESTGLGWCTVDLQGADDLRTESVMRQQVVDLQRLGLPVRGGIAASPLLASYAAREADPVCVVNDARKFLRDLPLAVAEPAPRQIDVLRGWGIKTLGDLTALTKADIGQRMGADGVALWERAAGETSRPLRLVELSRSFTAEWIYEPPIDMLEPLTFKLQRFGERIASELGAAGFVAEKLGLSLFLEDGKDHRRDFRLPEASANVASWMRVFLSHLETVRLDSPIERVRLVAEPGRPQQKQDGLFDTGLRDPAAFWENLARVGALVGYDRVGTPVRSDTHRPDAFVLQKPVDAVPTPEELPLHADRGLALRRFRPGWFARVELADGRPRVISGVLKGIVVTAHGPWRMTGEWWRPDRWSLEIWHVELVEGGVYQLTRDGNEWSIEGVFD